MRIFIEMRYQNEMEHNNRFLRHNYGSRKSYSIDEVILERRLIYNISRITMEPIIHVITDLSACYDR